MGLNLFRRCESRSGRIKAIAKSKPVAFFMCAFARYRTLNTKTSARSLRCLSSCQRVHQEDIQWKAYLTFPCTSILNLIDWDGTDM